MAPRLRGLGLLINLLCITVKNFFGTLLHRPHKIRYDNPRINKLKQFLREITHGIKEISRKKQTELANAEAKVKVLKSEVAELKQQVQLELVKKLQDNLHTDDLGTIEQFIAQATPTDTTTSTTADGGELDGH
ncbi:hypothetical protein GA0061075_10315 [Weissella hellenica]|uniref:Uncharacterized protein n=1 Tax=Weissella hellenica TaxID=46256 RepID=A0ABY0JZL7_WEIHE|nr:hypothetical protein WHE01_01140 [Weissella hellenica]SCB81227.1 hypothetical protein GA0061075_10315 [Weissella hellenica]